jgi:hypothetical protein
MSLDDPESISSVETEPSKPWTSIVALGEKIVQELGLGRGVDTLGKWMAHRIAELMLAAEHAATLEERDSAKQEVEKLILRVWDRRERWPGGYPLEGIEAAVKRLEVQADPMLRGRRRSGGSLGPACSTAFIRCPEGKP